VTTASELFASLSPGATVDLDGETITGDVVSTVPERVTVRGAAFAGGVDLYSAEQLVLDGCAFGPAPDGVMGCRLLGGHGWRVTSCTFRGGVTMAQLNVGLDWNARRTVEGCPTDWLVEGCTFAPLDGQAGEWPQGHQLYVLTTPRVVMNGRIERCTLSGTPDYGAALKLGGTGNYWRTEGVRGVTVTGCDIAGGVLTQGARTDVALVSCTLRGVHGEAASVAAMDGSRCRLVSARLPDGLTYYATWYVGPFGLWRREAIEAVVGRTRRGGIILT
jgi:hypothetical protein